MKTKLIGTRNAYQYFDEVDKGFDLRYQVGLHNMLTNLPVMHGVKILAVSHTLIPNAIRG